MSAGRGALLAACACWLWLLVCPVRADDSALDAELARLSFERGVAASELGDWQRAQREFQDSQQRAPKASTLFNLALAELRLGRFEQALSTLDAFDALADPDLHQHLIDRAGAVRVEAEAMATHARLQALERSMQEAAQTRRSGPAAGDTRARTLGRALISAGAVLAAGALGAGIWWNNRAENLDDCQRSDGVTCREHEQIARQTRAATGLTVALGVSAVGLVATGAVWLATRGKARRDLTWLPSYPPLAPTAVLRF